jgi:hypothetical protein
MMHILTIVLAIIGALVVIALGAIGYLGWYIWKMGQFEYKPSQPKATEGS